jgi:hypothetical protein
MLVLGNTWLQSNMEQMKSRLFPLLQPLTGLLLFRDLLLGRLLLLYFSNNVFLFAEDDFNVAWGAHVRVDPTMGAVCSSSHVRGSVDL